MCKQNSLTKDLCCDSSNKEPRPCPKGSFRRTCEETSLSEQPEAKRSREGEYDDQVNLHSVLFLLFVVAFLLVGGGGRGAYLPVGDENYYV